MNHRIEPTPTGPIEINRQAPIILSADIEVAAPPERVRESLSAIESWPSWNSEVKEASLDGDLAAGTVFRWKAGPSSAHVQARHRRPPIPAGVCSHRDDRRDDGWRAERTGRASHFPIGLTGTVMVVPVVQLAAVRR